MAEHQMPHRSEDPTGSFFMPKGARMKNSYRIAEDGHYIIFFRDGGCFHIDADDFDEVSKHSWHNGRRGYPTSCTSRRDPCGHKTITLHRLILGDCPGYDVDHISGDKMDNRKVNLRICTHQSNMFNQKFRNTNTSGFSGVHWNIAARKFEAYVHKDGKKYYLGLFDSPFEAAKARDAESLRLFGDFARLNFPQAVSL